MSGRFCIDTSAFHRRAHPVVVDRFAQLVLDDLISISDQARLEILFSARDADDYLRLTDRLTALATTPGGHRVWQRALQVQGLLAQRGGLHHRSVKIADLVVAASAEAAGDTVLHYDADFDRIAEVTGQPTEWIVPPGSV